MIWGIIAYLGMGAVASLYFVTDKQTITPQEWRTMPLDAVLLAVMIVLSWPVWLIGALLGCTRR